MPGITLLGLPWPGDTRNPQAIRDDSQVAPGAPVAHPSARTKPLIVISHVPPEGLGDTPEDHYHRGFAAYSGCATDAAAALDSRPHGTGRGAQLAREMGRDHARERHGRRAHRDRPNCAERVHGTDSDPDTELEPENQPGPDHCRWRGRPKMTRILLYTGKGGVGKTSVAAATAVLCAERGLRTLVVSTDIAHSLADALDTPVGPTRARSRRTCGPTSRTSSSTSRATGRRSSPISRACSRGAASTR